MTAILRLWSVAGRANRASSWAVRVLGRAPWAAPRRSPTTREAPVDRGHRADAADRAGTAWHQLRLAGGVAAEVGTRGGRRLGAPAAARIGARWAGWRWLGRVALHRQSRLAGLTQMPVDRQPAPHDAVVCPYPCIARQPPPLASRGATPTTSARPLRRGVARGRLAAVACLPGAGLRSPPPAPVQHEASHLQLLRTPRAARRRTPRVRSPPVQRGVGHLRMPVRPAPAASSCQLSPVRARRQPSPTVRPGAHAAIGGPLAGRVSASGRSAGGRWRPVRPTAATRRPHRRVRPTVRPRRPGGCRAGRASAAPRRSPRAVRRAAGPPWG